jgi:hypothetical protein
MLLLLLTVVLLNYSNSIIRIRAAVAVLIVGAVLRNGLMPVILIAIMAIACLGQVILDIKRHPHNLDSKF